MASKSTESAEQQPTTKIQIYPTANSGISSFWKGFFQSTFFAISINFASFFRSKFGLFADKYERDAKKYWDIFYKRHQDKVSSLIFVICSFDTNLY